MADALSPESLRPRTPIAGARAGEMVKIVGRLRPTGALFTAPLSGATCLWYGPPPRSTGGEPPEVVLLSNQPAFCS
jgi:hypothetical protein